MQDRGGLARRSNKLYRGTVISAPSSSVSQRLITMFDQHREW